MLGEVAAAILHTSIYGCGSQPTWSPLPPMWAVRGVAADADGLVCCTPR